MTMNPDTTRRLAQICDAAAFERIAAAVLRAANPAIYEELSHPGVQPGGKTVKAPFDNIAWVQSAQGARFACAAHTTEQKDLEGKWLHDPATVKPRKAGAKPTKPAGDLVKGMAEIQRLRDAHPGLAVTFALTTNLEIPLELLVLVKARALQADIELDMWSVSRIAHFLDTDPTGQIIRRNHLGTPVKLVSRELLLEMGERSIQDHLRLAQDGERITRDDVGLGRGDALMVGASGMGKTTLCATALTTHLDKGLPAIVLKTEFVAAATTLEAALESELRRQQPELEAGAGNKALSLCTEDEPLLVLVEDINRADSPERLLNKVLSWTRQSTNAQASTRLWRVLCPIWPRYLDTIEDQKYVFETVAVLRVDRYTLEEAVRAVYKRADALGLPMDEHRATSIASRLGQDPLLIGLANLTADGSAASVVQTYVGDRLRMVASQAQCTASEVVHALHQLLQRMLEHRCLGPRWDQVKAWCPDQEVIALLRRIAQEGSVMRLSEAEVIEFRHDRVMHSLLSEVIATVLKADTVPEYVTDPFFAEVVAGAAVQVELPLPQLAYLMDATPVVAAHALKLAAELDSRYAEIAAQVLSQWLQCDDVRTRALANRRYAVARVLAETTSPHVVPLVAQFPQDNHPWSPLLAAAFRNGHVGAGFAFLSMDELGVTVPGKHSLLALVQRTYGSKLVGVVDATLRRDDLSQPGQAGVRVGALRLAGYLGDRALAQAVRLCWDQDKDRDNHLRSYLFAAARCCGDDPEATLGPVCDAWDGLPEDPASEIGDPVTSLAADHVAWEFRSYPPRDAVRYFVARANASPKLEWPISYMLRTVDHPAAVEQIARRAAKVHFISASGLKSDWERHSRETGRRMSPASKARLLAIACDEAEPDDVRKQAFAFWELTLGEGDVEIARQIPAGHLLYERALWARARRQDRSVVHEILKKIPEAPANWLHIGRYLWSDALTQTLEPLVEQVAQAPADKITDLEYSVSGALRYVEPNRVVAMLRHHWERLRTKPLMVQTALLSTAPGAAALASEAFSSSQNPRALLKHFVSQATVESGGKRGLFSPAQLPNLKPYLGFFPDRDVEYLWQICTRSGWLAFRDQYLEPRLRNIPERRVRLSTDAVDTEDFDRALAGKMTFYEHWLEQQVNRGVAREKAVATMLDWLARHDEARALSIVADVISNSATRQEFERFEAMAAQRADPGLWVQAARFDVFSRSLA